MGVFIYPAYGFIYSGSISGSPEPGTTASQVVPVLSSQFVMQRIGFAAARFWCQLESAEKSRKKELKKRAHALGPRLLTVRCAFNFRISQVVSDRPPLRAHGIAKHLGVFQAHAAFRRSHVEPDFQR